MVEVLSPPSSCSSYLKNWNLSEMINGCIDHTSGQHKFEKEKWIIYSVDSISNIKMCDTIVNCHLQESLINNYTFNEIRINCCLFELTYNAMFHCIHWLITDKIREREMDIHYNLIFFGFSCVFFIYISPPFSVFPF